MPERISGALLIAIQLLLDVSLKSEVCWTATSIGQVPVYVILRNRVIHIICGILSVIVVENVALFMVRTVSAIITIDRRKIIEDISVLILLVEVRLLELSECETTVIIGRF